jgi:hypothetical protein
MLTRREDETLTAFTLRRLRAEFLEEAACIVMGEFVDWAATQEPTDAAYNNALMHAAEAIRRSAIEE